MDDEKTTGNPSTGSLLHGTGDQTRVITQWEKAGWRVLHWTDVPRLMAVMEGPLGDIIFIDRQGFAWQGPEFDRTRPVPLEKYPPASEWTIA